MVWLSRLQCAAFSALSWVLLCGLRPLVCERFKYTLIV
jgi:hypothetical protein